jgi:hypothetical protein
MPSLRLSAVLALAIVAVASSAAGQNEENSFLKPKPKPKPEAPAKPKPARKPGSGNPGGAPETGAGSETAQPDNRAAEAAAEAAAAQAAAEAAERQKLFEAQQAARAEAETRQRLDFAESIRGEIVNGRKGLVDKLISWQQKYGFQMQVGLRVMQGALRCDGMDSSEWTPADIIEATSPNIPPKQVYFDLRQRHAGGTFGVCMPYVNLPVTPMYGAMHGGHIEVVVWYIPIPLTRDARGLVPMATPAGTITQTGLRIVATEFVNTRFTSYDEVIILPKLR